MRQSSFGPHKAWAAHLIALHHGELAARERAAVEAHISGCQRCARAYTTYQEVAGAMQKLPGLLPPEPLELPQAEQGEHILEYRQQVPQQRVAETLLSQANAEMQRSSPATDENGAPITYSYGHRRRSGKTEGATRQRKKTSSRPGHTRPPSEPST